MRYFIEKLWSAISFVQAWAIVLLPKGSVLMNQQCKLSTVLNRNTYKTFYIAQREKNLTRGSQGPNPMVQCDFVPCSQWLCRTQLWEWEANLPLLMQFTVSSVSTTKSHGLFILNLLRTNIPVCFTCDSLLAFGLGKLVIRPQYI
jgi:hypothetical protein